MRGLDFNREWKFQETEVVQDLHRLEYDDSAWDVVNLPHDWSTDKSFDEELGEGCTAYLLGGIGWYRKTFVTTPEMEDHLVNVQFDGIYNRSDIYCNGTFITFHPFGYSPCLVDLTPYLAPVGEENVIAVHVDHSRYADSRWYTGSGIYRKVSMHVLPKCHVPVWGVVVNTKDITEGSATVCAKIQVKNTEDSEKTVEVCNKVYGPSGELVKEAVLTVEIGSGEEKEVEVELVVSSPELWDVLDSKMYALYTEVWDDGEVVQVNKETFGIRYFAFDKDKGFFLNGVNTLIKGVCLHHDVGCVGTAIPKAVWKRRLEILIEGGTNAIRTAHNPVSEDFLDLCDELGLLVQEEFYDEWDNPKDKRFNGTENVVDYITRGHHEFFQEYAEKDLKAVMKRDINHPSIIQWSIGNEIEWTYPKYNEATGYFGANASGNYFWMIPPRTKDEIQDTVDRMPRGLHEVGTTAQKLAKWTREVDMTRPVTANCILPSVSYATGYTDALDLVGYSYRQVIYNYGHENYDLPVMGTENVAQWHEWKAVLDREFVSGIFLWTGADYLGEAGLTKRKWPEKGSDGGLIDLASFKKPSYYMFQSLWTETPCVYIATQTVEKSLYELSDEGVLYTQDPDAWQHRLWKWQDVNGHWNYENHETIALEIYSNCDEVTLYVNGTEVSTQYLKDFPDHIYKWAVPFKKGTVKAVGRKGEAEVVYEIHTAKERGSVKLTADVVQTSTDLDDAVHVMAQLCDIEGNPITHSEGKVVFQIEGAHKLLGIDNGSTASVQDCKATNIVTRKGQCLLILQGSVVGNIKITATCEGVESNDINITVE